MFAFFERFLTPTAAPEHPEPPAGLIAFLWHFARQAKWLFAALVRDRIAGRAGRQRGAVVHGPRRHHGDQRRRPTGSLPRAGRGSSAWRSSSLVVRPSVTLTRYLITNQAIAAPFTGLVRWQVALARGAAELGVLPERFRRPHFQSRDADRAVGALDADRDDHHRLVHHRLRRIGDRADRFGRALACGADPAVVRRAMPALLFYFVPRMRERSKVSSDRALGH